MSFRSFIASHFHLFVTLIINEIVCVFTCLLVFKIPVQASFPFFYLVVSFLFVEIYLHTLDMNLFVGSVYLQHHFAYFSILLKVFFDEQKLLILMCLILSIIRNLSVPEIHKDYSLLKRILLSRKPGCLIFCI